MDERFSKLLAQIYSAVAELEAMFPGRHFTPDGHMVGSIGEAIAAYHYGVKLYPASHAAFDGRKDGKEIQIKATQRESVDLPPVEGGTLLVFRIRRDSSFEEVYNGDSQRVWRSLSSRKLTKGGWKSISLNQLRALQKEVGKEEKVAVESEPAMT